MQNCHSLVNIVVSSLLFITQNSTKNEGTKLSYGYFFFVVFFLYLFWLLIVIIIIIYYYSIAHGIKCDVNESSL